MLTGSNASIQQLEECRFRRFDRNEDADFDWALLVHVALEERP